MASHLRIYLIGPMGVGKSSIGRALARRIDWGFHDTDEEVCARTGVDLGLIFEKEGEAGFRRREADALRDLSDRARVVIATGGGTVLTEGNRSLMRARGYVVHLTSSVHSQLERTQRGRNRPALEGGDREDTLARMRAERDPLYLELADLTLATDGQDPRSVARTLCSQLQDHGVVA